MRKSLGYAETIAGEPFNPPHLLTRKGARLPHWTREGATYALTFRLADSIPQSLLQSWLRERRHTVLRAESLGRPLSTQELERLDFLYSEQVQDFLDQGAGECVMRHPRVADLVQSALEHFDGTRYTLIAWCVMPNHVHAIVKPASGCTLPQITHSWKSFTSTAANKMLGREGRLWQAESYDHIVRDGPDLGNQVRYVMHNPIKARLTGWAWVGRKDS